MDLTLNGYILQTSRLGPLARFVSELFELDPTSEEESLVLFDFFGLPLQLRESLGAPVLGPDLDLSVCDREQLDQLSQRAEFFFYRHYGSEAFKHRVKVHKNERRLIESVVIEDDDGRSWSVQYREQPLKIIPTVKHESRIS